MVYIRLLTLTGTTLVDTSPESVYIDETCFSNPNTNLVLFVNYLNNFQPNFKATF
jgi:hypothetical protein